MRQLILILCFSSILLGCNQNTNESKGTKKDIISDQIVQSDSTIVYWETDYDTIRKNIEVRIGNEIYKLEIKTYCKNDSSLSRVSDYNKFKSIYHDYMTEILLICKNDTILQSSMDKETFADSLSGNFYKYSVLKDVDFDFIRSNRLYFKAFLNVPDSDWAVESEFAVFYRTNKKGKIDSWNFKDLE